MSGPPLVEFRGVSKRFGHGPAVLQEISLQVAAGDFVSLIGPSGCGKSTLLRLLAGLIAPTEGSVSIAGAPPSAAAAELGFVFQDATLLPWLTVGGNVEAPLRLRHVPASQRVEVRDRVLALVQLADKRDAYPRQLSGGQKMRVSIARALALSPQLLLLDEPFGALDEMTREHLNEELLAIRERQAWTALFVTHSVAEAVFLSNRIVVLAPNPGRIHAQIDVALPYPRTDATRRSPAFHRYIDDVSASLRAVETPSAAA